MTLTITNGSIVTVEQLQAWLRTDPNCDVTLLQMIANAVTAVVERVTGPLAARSITEYYDGGSPTISLNTQPVLSVQSVSEVAGTATYPLNLQTSNAGPWSAFDVFADTERGTISRRGFNSTVPFMPGARNVAVTYTAGSPIGIDAARLAALMIARDFYVLTMPSGRTSQQQQITTTMIDGYIMPPAAMAALAPFQQVPGIA